MVSFVAGYFVFDKSTEVGALQSKLAQSKLELEQVLNAKPRSLSGRLSRNPSLAIPLGVSKDKESVPSNRTNEEIDLTTDLLERRKKGEYLLEQELPASRKFMEQRQKQIVEETAKRNTREYSQVFSELGLNPEVSAQLQTHVSKIQKASLDVSAAQSQVLWARDAYDKKLRSLLTDEGYSSYRAYEASKPAVREYSVLQEYAQQQNFTVDPAYEQRLANLIEQTQAFTFKSYQGPFDRLPEVGVGKEMVTVQLQQDIADFTERKARIVQVAAEQGLPEEYRKLIDSYFTERINETKRSIQGMDNPSGPPQAVKDWMKKSEERLAAERIIEQRRK